MSFDKLYEGEGGNKLQRTQSGTSPVKEGSFMGMPGLSKKRSGVRKSLFLLFSILAD